MDTSDLVEKLKDRRLSVVAKRIGVSKTTLNNFIKSGRCSLDTYIKLDAYLNPKKDNAND